jgi:sugar phosphate isomerase/epimerase
VTRALGASTFAFAWKETALDALRRLRGLGLDGFDVVLAPGHCWPAELSPAERSRLASTLAAEGIRLDSLNFPALDLNLASCVAEVRAYSVARYREAMELGAELGVRGVVAVPGRVSPLIGPPLGETERWLAESVAELLRVAHEVDVCVFLELHPQTPVPTVDALDRFVARFDDPLLRIAYDVANAEFVSENHAEALRRLAPRLAQVHLSDATAARWAHDPVGRGTVDFTTVFATLDEIAFGGGCVLEVVTPTPVPDLVASLEALASGGPARLPLVDTGATG